MRGSANDGGLKAPLVVAGRALRRRGLALLPVFAVLASAVPASAAIAEGDRPLRPPASTAPRVVADDALEQAEQAGIDVGGVIEKVQHHIAPSNGSPRVLAVDDPAYRAEFAASGFALRLRGPARAARFEIVSAAVRRGPETIETSFGEWRGSENRASRTVAPGLLEQVTARDGHVEWDFVLARPLAGAGDLVIDARVDAAGPAVRTSTGWRWPLGSGRGVEAGELVVKDRSGRELHRALPGVGSGSISLTVPGHVLTGAAYPLTIDPVISPEYPASEPVLVPGAPETQEDPAVASDGATFLVVWTDWRNWREEEMSLDVFGARVTADGTLLDESGIAISAGPSMQNAPAAVWNGQDFLVAWRDLRSGNGDVYGARVSTAGAVLDPSGIPIAVEQGAQTSPSLAHIGTRTLVAWSDGRSASFDVYGARLDRAGTVLDPNGIAISSSVGHRFRPGVAASRPRILGGAEFFVVWDDERSGTSSDTYGARVAADGSVLDPAGIAIATNSNYQELSTVASDGSDYLVVWAEAPSPTSENFDVHGARVSIRLGGDVTVGTPFAVATGAKHQYSPEVAWDGTNFLVAWGESDDFLEGPTHVVGTRVSATGTVHDPSGFQISANGGSAPALAWDGESFLVAFQQGGRGVDISASRVSSSGTVLDGEDIAVSTGVTTQTSPSVAWDGTNFLLV